MESVELDLNEPDLLRFSTELDLETAGLDLLFGVIVLIPSVQYAVRDSSEYDATTTSNYRKLANVEGKYKYANQRFECRQMCAAKYLSCPSEPQPSMPC